MSKSIILLSFLLLTYFKSTSQILSQSNTRAISINEVIFELKGNILGEFYITPIIDSCYIKNDSVMLYGTVFYLRKPKEGVQIYICKKEKRKLWEIIGKQQLYRIIKFAGETDSNGKFKVSLNYNKEWMIFRDYILKQDQFHNYTLKYIKCQSTKR